MRRHALAVAVLVFITSLADGSGLTQAQGVNNPPGNGCKDLPSWDALRARAPHGARAGQWRAEPGYVGHDRRSGRRGVRGGVHRQRSPAAVARQPRHFGAEGEHGELVQPARLCRSRRRISTPPCSRAAASSACRRAIRSRPTSPTVETLASMGRQNDPMVGGRIGGVNVFGGGLALQMRRASSSAPSASAAIRRAPITTSHAALAAR